MKAQSEVFREPQRLDEYYAEIARLTHTIADEFLTSDHSVADYSWEHDGLTEVEFQFKATNDENPRHFGFVQPRNLLNKTLNEYRIALNGTVRLDLATQEGYVDTISLGYDSALGHAAHVMAMLQTGIQRPEGYDADDKFAAIVLDYAIDQVPGAVKTLAKHENQQIRDAYIDGIVDMHKESRPKSSKRWRLNKDTVRERLDARVANQKEKLGLLSRKIGAISAYLTGGMLDSRTNPADN